MKHIVAAFNHKFIAEDNPQYFFELIWKGYQDEGDAMTGIVKQTAKKFVDPNADFIGLFNNGVLVANGELKKIHTSYASHVPVAMHIDFWHKVVTFLINREKVVQHERMLSSGILNTFLIGPPTWTVISNVRCESTLEFLCLREIKRAAGGDRNYLDKLEPFIGKTLMRLLKHTYFWL